MIDFTQLAKAAVEEMKGAIVDDVVNRVVARLIDSAKRPEPPSELDIRTRIFNMLANHPSISFARLARWWLEGVMPQSVIDSVLDPMAADLPNINRAIEQHAAKWSPTFEIVRLLRLNGQSRACMTEGFQGRCFEEMHTGQKFYPTDLRDRDGRRIFIEREEAK